MKTWEKVIALIVEHNLAPGTAVTINTQLDQVMGSQALMALVTLLDNTWGTGEAGSFVEIDDITRHNFHTPGHVAAYIDGRRVMLERRRRNATR